MSAERGEPTGAVTVERDGRDWRVWLELSAWPHRALVRAFGTKRSAEAAARMLRAREANAADARTIIADDAKRWAQRQPYDAATIWHNACEFFWIVFGQNAGLPFAGGRPAFEALLSAPTYDKSGGQCLSTTRSGISPEKHRRAGLSKAWIR